VGQYRERKIYQVDPQTGAILRTIVSKRFVTGVTWVDGELWHGTWEGDESDLRRVDPRTGEVVERLEMPPGVGVSGLESDGGDLFFCGGGPSGKVRTVRRPKRAPRRAAAPRSPSTPRGRNRSGPRGRDRVQWLLPTPPVRRNHKGGHPPTPDRVVLSGARRVSRRQVGE
jgi:hypothetical protein